ncbi:MAG: T9SS type A sorting domain-containing protein [Bacteroidales bacterium]|jgi:hypothetical protein
MKIKNIYTTVCLFFVSFLMMGQFKAYTPTLVTPEDEEENMMPIVLLDWDAVSGYHNLRYNIQISTSNNFQNLVVDEEVTTSAYHSIALKFNTTYYWRVKAIDDNNASDWSEVRSFITTDAFVNISPSNDNQSPRPQLNWESKNKRTIEGIDKFEILIDSDSTFNSYDLKQIFVLDENNNFGNSFSVRAYADSLNFGQKYFWKVRAYNSGEGDLADISDWSEAMSFRVVTRNELNKPQMTGDKNLNVSPTELLSLKNSYAYCQYIFQVDIDEEFSDPFVYHSNKNSVNIDTLKFGEKYYWRAAMRYGNSTSEWTEETWWFTIINAPVLLEPKDGTEATPEDLIKTRKIEGVERYTLEISTSSDFNPSNTKSYDFPQSTTTYFQVPIQNVHLSEYDKTYYWRVKAANKKHGETLWSETRNFILKEVVGIEDNDYISDIFPNPNNGNFYFVPDNNINDAIINIYDLTGRSVYSEKTTLQKGVNKSINTSLNTGLYILQINSKDVNISKKFSVM